MKIKILPQAIVAGIPSEDELADHSLMESLYCIRSLKVAAFYGSDTVVEVSKINSSGQVFIEDFDIWINQNEYQVVED